MPRHRILICQQCQREFSPNHGRPAKFCSQRCNGEYHKKERPPKDPEARSKATRARWARERAAKGIPDEKVCEHCARTYSREEIGHQPYAHWLARKFCSMDCRNLAMKAGAVFPRGEEHWAWKGDAVGHPNARTRRVAERFSDRPEWCERCGFMLTKEIHHRDRNVLNNARENLEFLCVVCHDFEHGVPDAKRREHRKRALGDTTPR